jgi:hypothetical protein
MRTPIEKCYGSNWKVFHRGRSILLALPQTERQRIMSKLTLDQRERLARVENTVYVRGN